MECGYGGLYATINRNSGKLVEDEGTKIGTWRSLGNKGY